MDYLLQDCLRFNDEAIVLTRSGQLVQGALFLRKSLENLELCFQYQRSHLPSVGRSHRATMQVPSGPQTTNLNPTDDEEFQFKSISIESDWTEQLKAISAQNALSFYPRMFRIVSAGQSQVDLKKALLILMFNEAVSRHIIAALFVHRHKMLPDSHMTQVMAMYEAILRAARASFRFSDSKKLLCVIVAAANNFGHVASHLMLFRETRESIEYTIRLLEISDDSSFGAVDVHLFFESICIFLEGRNLRNAPAA
jgi:hypothetical protein